MPCLNHNLASNAPCLNLMYHTTVSHPCITTLCLEPVSHPSLTPQSHTPVSQPSLKTCFTSLSHTQPGIQSSIPSLELSLAFSPAPCPAPMSFNPPTPLNYTPLVHPVSQTSQSPMYYTLTHSLLGTHCLTTLLYALPVVIHDLR